MNKKDLAAIVTARLKKMKKYSDSIEKDFREEDIHKFRVEVKKFRAFLRMIALELKDPKKGKLPRKLKEINTRAGVIRDIHLHLQRIQTAFPAAAAQPDRYLDLLKRKMSKNKKRLAKLLSKDPIPSLEKKIVDILPEELALDTVAKFVQQKSVVIASLIAGRHEEDEDLHTIRKNLKDLMYDVKIFQEDARHASAKPLMDTERIKEIDVLARHLGEFNDMCFALLFLDRDHLEQVDEAEKTQLLQIQEGWLQEKKTLKQAALNNLSAFYPSFVSV